MPRSLLTVVLIAQRLAIPDAGAQELTGTLKKIKDSNALTLGYRESSIPFSYVNRHFPDTEVVGRDLPSLGGSAATKFDRSRLVDSQNDKMLGPAGPKLAALCSSRRTSAVVGCRI
jgi:hypothetical protein